MHLSIVTPAAPKRKARIAMIFNRLKLNAQRHPEIMFEFIIVDDSLDQEYRQLATGQDWGFPVKYISLPLTEPYPNPSYMRNVGFRIAEGRVFTMIDADHWVHEDFIEGAVEPFLAGLVLNTGFMIDTSKGNKFQPSVNEILINRSGDLSFADCMTLCGINGPAECRRVWLAAYPADKFLAINGYDEHYTTGYSREDDDIYYRLGHVCDGIYTKSFQKFAGVHLWHPQGARNDAKNALNREYYDRISPANATRNQEHQWGKFVRGSCSVIEGVELNFQRHEEYVGRLARVEPYLAGEDCPWEDFAELQACVTKK